MELVHYKKLPIKNTVIIKNIIKNIINKYN